MAFSLIIAVTVLAGIGKVPFEDWQEYTLYVFGIYVGGKTIQGVATTVAEAKRDTPPALPAGPVSSTVVVTQPAAPTEPA